MVSHHMYVQIGRDMTILRFLEIVYEQINLVMLKDKVLEFVLVNHILFSQDNCKISIKLEMDTAKFSIHFI